MKGNENVLDLITGDCKPQALCFHVPNCDSPETEGHSPNHSIVTIPSSLSSYLNKSEHVKAQACRGSPCHVDTNEIFPQNCQPLASTYTLMIQHGLLSLLQLLGYIQISRHPTHLQAFVQAIPPVQTQDSSFF